MIRNALIVPLCLATVVGLLSQASPARAESVIFAGSGTNSVSGHSLAGSIEFKMLTSTKMEITLTNTSTFDPTSSNNLVPSDLLSAVFFDIVGPSAPGSSNFLSAIASSVVKKVTTSKWVSGKYVTTTSVNTQTDVNVKYPGLTGGWRYAKATSSSGLAPKSSTLSASNAVTQKYGFGTAGFTPSIFGSGGGGQQLDYGIVNSNYDALTDGNSGIGGSSLVKNSVTFTLSGLASGFNPATGITNVRFQYGTALADAHFDGTKVVAATATTPEPSSFVLLGIGAVGLFGIVRRKKKSQASRSAPSIPEAGSRIAV